MLGGRIANVSLVLVCVATACGSTHSISALPSTNPDACEVISPAVAQRVLGSPVTRGNQIACVYVSARGVAAATLQVSTTSALARLFADERSGTLNLAPGGSSKRPTPRTISRLGDEALWDGQWLFVRARKWLLGVSVHDSGSTADLTRSTALARLGLQRLDA